MIEEDVNAVHDVRNSDLSQSEVDAIAVWRIYYKYGGPEPFLAWDTMIGEHAANATSGSAARGRLLPSGRAATAGRLGLYPVVPLSDGQWDGFANDGASVTYSYRRKSDRLLARRMQFAAAKEFARMRADRAAGYVEALLRSGMSYTRAARLLHVPVARLHRLIARSHSDIVVKARRERLGKMREASGWGPVVEALRTSDTHTLEIPDAENVKLFVNRLRTFMRDSRDTCHDLWSITREGRMVTVRRRIALAREA